VLPKGFQRVREYGLMHGSAKPLRQQVLLLLMRLGMKVLCVAPTKAQRQCSSRVQSRMQHDVGLEVRDLWLPDYISFQSLYF
jgi:hypothetical protein